MIAALLFAAPRTPFAGGDQEGLAAYGDAVPGIMSTGKRHFWHGPQGSPSMPQEVSAG
jgi:hypothetical protein